MSRQTVRVVEEYHHVVVTSGSQGVPGRDADVVGATLYLAQAMRLAEFNTQQAKLEARTNLELENIDGGTFN